MAPGPDSSSVEPPKSSSEGTPDGTTPAPGIDPYGLTESKNGDRYFPIAIVGMGVRMPMSETVDEFAKVLEHEICAITPVPADRWSFNDFYTDDVNQRGHHCITKLAFCEKYYHFDPHFFNMSPREAQFVDPQHRQVMEVTDEALQDAGITPETLPKNTGVYIGMGIIDFPGAFLENRYLYNAHTLPGFTHTLSANRVSYNYGLTGPSCALDTACAASLTAIHVGCMSMWNKECEAAIVGATSNLYAPETTVAFSHLGVLSPNGNSAPFDISNNGYVRGEGTGILVLKPLADAVRDNDHVYCVIRGTTSAHNGNSKSLTLPSADAQEELITRCYSQFGIPLDKVSYVEAHGTGTPVGDPLETVALGRTFGASRKEPLRISSAKSNFGHLEVCAGMVQVVKAAIMLDRRMMYKQIKWTAPNTRIDFDKLNLRIQTKQEAYTDKDNFIIGINTFGFGGSLVHMVFEEYKNRPVKRRQDQLAGWQFGKCGQQGRTIAIPLSGKTKVALKNTVQKWLQFKHDEDAQVAAAWQATRRVHHRERVVILADSSDDFRDKARAFVSGQEADGIICDSVHPTSTAPKTCLIFSGYGQQWEDIGRKLYANEPAFRLVVDECDSAFKKVTGYSALEKHKIFIAEGKGRMENGAIDKDACKPAILFYQVAVFKLLDYWGIKPDMVMGVGLGEVTAALACGAFSLEDAMRSMHVRMGAPPKDDFLQKMKTVLNGPKPTNASFYSTITGQKYDGPLDADYWWRNVLTEGSKKIGETVRSVLNEDERTTFIEISASEMLLPLVKKTLREENVSNLTVACGQKHKDDYVSIQEATAALHCTGYKVNWANVTRNCASFVPVPLYGWDHQIIRLESIEYLGRRCGLDDRSFKAQDGVLNFEKHPYLRDYMLHDDYVFPTAGFVEFFTEHDDSELSCLKDVRIKHNIKVEPLHPDGFINDTVINIKRNGSGLTALATDGDLLAEATLATSGSPEMTPVVDLNIIKSRCLKHVDVEKQYDIFQKMGLNYARAYKILSDIAIGEGEALATIRGSKLKHERINTPFLDAAFQVALAAFNPSTSLYLPFEINQLQMFVAKVSALTPARVHAVLKGWSITEFEADITITDESGKVLVQVTGMKARNITSETTDVELDACLYTTKWQSSSATLPSTQTCEAFWTREALEAKHRTDISTLEWTETNIDKLEQLAAAHCKDVLNNLPEDFKLCNSGFKSLLENSSLLAKETDASIISKEILTAAPGLSAEIAALRLMSKQAQEILASQDASRNFLQFPEIKNLLDNSVSTRVFFRQCADMMKEAVSIALKEKDVIRVCQIGCGTNTLTLGVVEALREYVEMDRIEYVCTAAEEATLGELQKSLGTDLPRINYQVLDPNKPLEEQNMVLKSFDILLAFDPLGHLQSHVPSIEELLADNGWLLLIEAVHNTNLLDLMLAGNRTDGKALSEIQWCKALRKNGFAELRTLSPQAEVFYSVVLGRKVKTPPVDSLSTQSRWIIVSNRLEQAKISATKCPEKSKFCGPVEFLSTHQSLLAENSKQTEIIWFWDDNTNDMNEVLELVEIIRALERRETVSLWFVSEESVQGQKSITAAVPIGYLRAAANEDNLQIYSIQIPAGATEDVVEIINNFSSGEREVIKTEKGMFVPRIVRLPGAGQSAYTVEWIAKVADSGLQCQSSTKQPLKANEVRINVRGFSVQSFAENSFKAFAGTVEEVGLGVIKFCIGDAVMTAGLHCIGSGVIAAEASVLKKSARLSWTQAAETLLNFTIAYDGLVEEGALEEGETVLVDSPHTGLGQAAIQVAKCRGAKVICTSKKETCSRTASKFGMVVMADPASPSFISDLMQFTNNSGVDIVFQTTEEDLPAKCLDVLAYGARICKTRNQHSTLAQVSNATVLPPLNVSIEAKLQRVQEVASVIAARLESGKYCTFNTEPNHVSSVPEKMLEKNQMPTDVTCSFTVPDGYVPSELHQPDLKLNSNATYVVTGAYGRIGQEVARWLADMGAKHVAMVSKSGCKTCFHKATRRYIENRSSVHDIKADMSKETDVIRMFDVLTKQKAPEVKGIFHLAGYTDDLSSPSHSVISKMFSIQTAGAQYLHEESTRRQIALDYFVLFSSSVVAWGNHRERARCATHNALEAVAENRRKQSLPALAIQLGLVRGCGAVFEDEILTAEEEAAGMKSLHIHEYLNLIRKLLQTTGLPALVAITNQDWSSTSDSCHNGCLRISHLFERGANTGTLSGTDAGETLEQTVRQYIGGLTGSAPEDLDLLMPMQQFGVDSLMSQDIIAWAEKSFKITIEQSDIFGGLTCAQLLSKIGE